MTIEDWLSGFSADLLSYRDNHRFLRKLFSAPAGYWLQVVPLCEGLPDIMQEQLSEAPMSVDDLFWVMWLHYPSIKGEGYCLILFFVAGIDWHTIAIYNRAHFFELLDGISDQ